MNWLLLFLALVAAPTPPREGNIAADDGTRLFYRVEGAGAQTLVVVHGGPGNSLESVRLDLAPLARGRRVIYYDQRGNGRSDLVDQADRLAVTLHVADLEAIRRHFGLDRMVLLGNSWGGLLVSAYAAAHPDRVERMILHAPAPPTLFYLHEMGARTSARAAERLTPDQRSRAATIGDPRAWLAADDPFAICRDFMAMIFRLYVFDPAVPVDFRGNVCAGSREAVRRQQWVNAAIWRSLGEFDLRPGVERVTAPVLVIHGAADVIPLAGSRDWAAHYPNGRLLVLERAGHLVHLERPDAFFSAVEAFLAGRWPEGVEDRPARRRADGSMTGGSRNVSPPGLSGYEHPFASSIVEQRLHAPPASYCCGFPGSAGAPCGQCQWLGHLRQQGIVRRSGELSGRRPRSRKL